MPTDIGGDGESVVTYELSSDEPFSRAVVRAVSAIVGRKAAPDASAPADSERELEPLYAAIDPEALDSIFRTTDDASGTGGRVTFTHQGCEVTIHSEGRLSARPLEPLPRGRID